MTRDLHPRYSHYDVLDKWDSPSWNAPTRKVVAERLGNVPHRRFFTESEWDLLHAVCARLVPQPKRAPPIPLVPWIDHDIHEERTSGTRLEALPPLKACWRRGLSLIEAEAQTQHRCGFGGLGPSTQDALLRAVDRGEVGAPGWRDFPPQTFFRKILLKTVVSVYYAHPDAWSEIGFGGPASPRGYARLGMDRRDPWEAEEEVGARKAHTGAA
jgi:hypothetical protein